MSTPNIYVKKHNECWQQEWFGGKRTGRIGDVRRCEHGKMQVLIPPHRLSNVQGPGAAEWKTLSPFSDFRQYRLAQKALGER